MVKRSQPPPQLMGSTAVQIIRYDDCLAIYRLKLLSYLVEVDVCLAKARKRLGDQPPWCVFTYCSGFPEWPSAHQSISHCVMWSQYENPTQNPSQLVTSVVIHESSIRNFLWPGVDNPFSSNTFSFFLGTSLLSASLNFSAICKPRVKLTLWCH